jgi:hypothetical protein
MKMKKIASEKNYRIFKGAGSWSDRAKHNREVAGRNCWVTNDCQLYIRYMELFGEGDEKWTREEAIEQERIYSCPSSDEWEFCASDLHTIKEKHRIKNNLSRSDMRGRMKKVKQSLKTLPPA